MGAASFFFFGAPLGAVASGGLAADAAVVAGAGALGPLPLGAVVGALDARAATISGEGSAFTIPVLYRQIPYFGLREYSERSALATYPTMDIDFTSAFQFQPPAFQTDAFQIFSLEETSSRARVSVRET